MQYEILMDVCQSIQQLQHNALYFILPKCVIFLYHKTLPKYILSINVAKSIVQYSNTKCILSFNGPTATSTRFTIFGCADNFYNILISLKQVIGNPSLMSCILTFLMATILLANLSLAAYTVP